MSIPGQMLWQRNLESYPNQSDHDQRSSPSQLGGCVLRHSPAAIDNQRACAWSRCNAHAEQAVVRSGKEEAGLPGKQKTQPGRFELRAGNKSRGSRPQEYESDQELPLCNAQGAPHFGMTPGFRCTEEYTFLVDQSLDASQGHSPAQTEEVVHGAQGNARTQVQGVAQYPQETPEMQE